MTRRPAVLASIGGIVIAAALGCGPGPTADPSTQSAKAKELPGPECPGRPETPSADPTKLAGVFGKRIAKMCLFGVDGDVRGEAQKAFRSHEGDALDPEKVREDIGALLKLGIIDDVSVSALPAGKDVIVVYVIRERPRISEVVFEGANVFEKEGLTGNIAMQKQRPLVLGEVRDLVTAMREEYARRGYRSATVDSKIETVGPNLVRLKFVVVEGPQWKFGKVSFGKTTKIPEADLKKAVVAKEGEPFDEEKIDQTTAQVSALYLDRGMIQASVDHVVGQPDKDGKADVTFTINEGDVFHVGAIKLGKLAGANQNDLLPKLKTKPKQVFSRAQLLDDVKTIKDTFEARGQKVDVVPTTNVDAKKKTVDVTLDVEAAQ